MYYIGVIMAKFIFDDDSVFDLIVRLNSSIEFVSLYMVRVSECTHKELYEEELNGIISVCDTSKYILSLIGERLEEKK